MIAIVDYGMGNLFSIYNALVRVNAAPEIVREPEGLAGADGIVVPGVGAGLRFDQPVVHWQARYPSGRHPASAGLRLDGRLD